MELSRSSRHFLEVACVEWTIILSEHGQFLDINEYIYIYIYMSLDLSQSSHANYWDCSVQHEPSGETLLMFAYRVDLSVLAPCVVCGWLEADDACFEVRS